MANVRFVIAIRRVSRYCRSIVPKRREERSRGSVGRLGFAEHHGGRHFMKTTSFFLLMMALAGCARPPSDDKAITLEHASLSTPPPAGTWTTLATTWKADA